MGGDVLNYLMLWLESMSMLRRSGEQGRHHMDCSLVQKAMRAAVQAAGIHKPAKCHTLRHSQWLRHAGLRPGKATHLLEHGYDIRTI